MKPEVRRTPGGSQLRLRVSPGARKPGVGVREDGVLLVRVSAPPVEGAANEAVLRLLARELLGLPQHAVRLVRGAQGRDKVVDVDLPPEELLQRLLPALDGAGSPP